MRRATDRDCEATPRLAITVTQVFKAPVLVPLTLILSATSPRPIAAQVKPNRLTIGNALRGELVGLKRDAQACRQVASAIVTPTDGTSTVSHAARHRLERFSIWPRQIEHSRRLFCRIFPNRQVIPPDWKTR